jgi:hypothetical protein
MTEQFINYHPNLITKANPVVTANSKLTNDVQYKRRQILRNQANIKANLKKGITPGNRYITNKKTKMSQTMDKKIPFKNTTESTKNDAQLTENSVYIGDNNPSSLDTIELKINEIITFLTISNQKNYIDDDALCDIIIHLCAILKSKGNVKNINKLNKLLIENSELSNLNLTQQIKQMSTDTMSTHNLSELVLDLINNTEIVKDKKEELKITQPKIFGY